MYFTFSGIAIALWLANHTFKAWMNSFIIFQTAQKYRWIIFYIFWILNINLCLTFGSLRGIRSIKTSIELGIGTLLLNMICRYLLVYFNIDKSGLSSSSFIFEIYITFELVRHYWSLYNLHKTGGTRFRFLRGLQPKS